ncbi:MAG: NifU family protein [Pseudomonadota bacterium]|nr:NifU family protein [Pseudomonadota bacterium]
MFIQTHPEDDPELMRFTPGEPVLPVGKEPLSEAETLDISPLARRLLRIEGVEGVSLSLDDITLRRSGGTEWYILKPAVLGAIMEHYGAGEPVIAEPVVLRLLELLDGRIRPAIEAYGGEVLFKKFADGTLTLELIGGGGAQKRDMMTNIISHHVPEVESVTWVGEAPAAEIPDWLLNGKEEPPTGPEAEAVMQLLDEKVNPAVAAHGGQITLIDVADHIAYVRMEGGCQGCSSSAVTLQQGVQNAIISEVPTIQGVVDLTDHSQGVNPFFE